MKENKLHIGPRIFQKRAIADVDHDQEQDLQENVNSIAPPTFQLQLNSSESKTEKEEQETESQESSTENYQFDTGEAPSVPPSDGSDDSGADAPPNNTGLPNQLKSGIEGLSGFSMDDVKVHYNSSKPAQLQAHAYAQGTNIHLGPGQEKHLPHEAWHVIQQKQGRVRPTMQMKAFNINDDAGLEQEADIMGTKAMNIGQEHVSNSIQLKVNSTTHSNQDTAQLAGNSNAALESKMGKFKFLKAKQAGRLDRFREMEDDKLEEIKLQERKQFMHDLHFGFLSRDDDFEEAEPSSWFGGFLSRIGFGETEDEGDRRPAGFNRDLVNEFHQGENRTTEQSLSEESASGLFNEEEEESSIGDKLLKQVNITLYEGKTEGSANLGAAGNLEGKGEIGATLGAEGFEGEAKVEIKAGKEGKTEVGFGKFGSDSSNIAAGGTIEGHIGAKANLEGEASFNPREFSGSVKGKAGASAGVSTEGTVQIMVTGGGTEIAKFGVTGGMMLGIGGEFSYIAKWEGGELVIGSSGKAAVGLGLSWGYKMKLNTPGMMAKFGDWMSSWGSWGWNKLTGR